MMTRSRTLEMQPIALSSRRYAKIKVEEEVLFVQKKKLSKRDIKIVVNHGSK